MPLIPAVSVAKDRGWFKTYTAFTSRLNASPLYGAADSYLPVLGIGRVEIPTKRSPRLSGEASHGTLNLQEVLHVPEITCNIIGQTIATRDGYGSITLGGGKNSRGTIKDEDGKNVAYFDPNSPLLSIKVRGPPAGPKLGPHVLKKKDGVFYMLSAMWEPPEEAEWRRFKIQNGLSTGVVEQSPPYTPDELAYVKAKWGSEYEFLLQHGLHIHKDEDREEGRGIVRAFMEETDSEEDASDDEWDPEGHQADYHFSHAQLEWIEKHYRNSENFMISYGLKFYDMDDVEEAKAIADGMMNDDDGDEGDDDDRAEDTVTHYAVSVFN